MNLAIIGIGPRGLSALEHFCNAISKYSDLNFPCITMYEREYTPGSGQVWSTAQSSVNWLNISQRALHELKGREAIDSANVQISGFPSYIDWLPKKERNSSDEQPDLFPPRSLMGKYLFERFESITKSLSEQACFNVVQADVKKITYHNQQFTLHCENDKADSFDEVLLCIGHQPIEKDEQLAEWYSYALNKKDALLFTEPYPVERLQEEPLNGKNNIAIRGFGLATLDVIRALTIDRGGNFEIVNEHTFESVYHASQKNPLQIIPFSLDGKPMVSKPLNARIDNKFTPSEEEMEDFKSSIRVYTDGEKEADDIHFLKSAIAKIAALQYQGLEEQAIHQFEQTETLVQTIYQWLEEEDIKHPALYNAQETVTTIDDYNQMALGDRLITLDYCVGQVWRHCQPDMYQLFSHAKLNNELMAKVVVLDERMKRYAYGPPLESMQQLLALHKAGILNFDYVNNPTINLVENGWEISKDSSDTICSTMINSILDAPALLKVTSPLITNLLSDDLLQPVHSELGIKTKPNGLIELKREQEQIPLTALGRLCQGSVLGVDAILECFRLRIDDWAEGVVERMKDGSTA